MPAAKLADILATRVVGTPVDLMALFCLASAREGF